MSKTKVVINNELIHNRIKDVFKEVEQLRIKRVSKEEPYIRPSMAPACSLPMFISIAEGTSRGSTWESEDHMMMDYYTSCGTTTHEVLQKWFGHTGKLLGNWSCKCKGTKIVKVKVGRTVKRVERNVVYFKEISPRLDCPHCGKSMHYEEVLIRCEGFSGHLDGILEFTVNNKKVHIIIDFKGTRLDKVKRHNPRYLVFPDPKHKKQISIYTWEMSKREELNVIGWALLYTSRDTPIPGYTIIPHIMTQADWDEAELLFNSQVKQIDVLYRSLDDGNIKRILKHKLCENHGFYREHVESMYNKCKYADICFSAPKELLGILKEAKSQLNLELKKED